MTSASNNSGIRHRSSRSGDMMGMETPFVLAGNDSNNDGPHHAAADEGDNYSTMSPKSRSVATTFAAQLAQQHAQDLALSTINTDAARRREKKRQKKYTIAIAVTALSAFFLAIAAMWVEASVVAYLAFVFPLFVGPYVIRQRRKLNKLPTLRYVMNQLRSQVNLLMVQNSKLHHENNRLQTQVTRLGEAERSLAEVAAQSGSNVQAVCDLVRENAETLRDMKRLQKAKELQNILTVVLQSDTDGDHVVAEQELEMLLLRLTTFSAADESKLRLALQQSGKNAVSTTTLYNTMVASGSFGDDAAANAGYDYTQWLFEEEEGY